MNDIQQYSKILQLIGKFESFAINTATGHKQAYNAQIILQLNKTGKYQDLFVYFPSITAFLFLSLARCQNKCGENVKHLLNLQANFKVFLLGICIAEMVNGA